MEESVYRVSVMDEIKKLAKKVDMIQRDLDFLKLSLSKEFQTKKVVSLKGALRGIEIGDEDVEEAKKSLFKSGA
jgi:hypothetical protein